MAKPTPESELYVRALAFATKKHAGQVRRGGMPYICHPTTVADIVNRWGYGKDYVITAFFHDLLEDTDATDAEIEEIGGPVVLEAVHALTKEHGYVMADYVAGIRANEVARVVKAADRLHNLRSAVLTSEDFKRRYILETLDWYMDLSPEIPPAVRDLAKTLEEPIAELDLAYSPVDRWKIGQVAEGEQAPAAPAEGTK